MARDSADFQLANFDDAPPLTIDPAVFDRNLAAISAEQPALAAQLRAEPLPITWRPVLALDDWPTWRCEGPGRAAEWLCDTAVPRTRADALLSIYQPGDLNATLPGIACGAELALLLERLPAHKGIYVFERDPAALSAVLRVVDVSADISSGRCVILHSDDLAEPLAAHLQRWSAMLPPGNIMLIPGVGDEHIAALRAIVERFATERLANQTRELDQLLAARVEPVSAEARRIGIFCGAPQRGAINIAEAISHAAATAGWNTSTFLVRGPRDVHPLAAARWAAAFRPSATLCIGHRAALLPKNISGEKFEWLWMADENKPTESAVYHRTFAASEIVAERIANSCPSATGTQPLFFAADERLADYSGINQKSTHFDGLCLIGDRPLDDDEHLAKMQPTHQLLWRHLRDAVRSAWRDARPLDGETLLSAAERLTGVRIGESSVRPLFIDAVDRVLIPNVIVETAIRAARERGLRVWAIGGGWQAVEFVDYLGDDVITAQNEIRMLCSRPAGVLAIFPYSNEPWPPALLNVMIAGIPHLLFTHRRLPDCASARGIQLQTLRTYAGLREFTNQFTNAIDHAAEQFHAAAALGRTIGATHTWRARLSVLDVAGRGSARNEA